MVRQGNTEPQLWGQIDISLNSALVIYYLWDHGQIRNFSEIVSCLQYKDNVDSPLRLL